MTTIPGIPPHPDAATPPMGMRTFVLGAMLAAVVLVSFFYNLGGAPLFDRDEGAFSEATREMFVRGDFISTYLNGEPRFDKPILIYWFQALSVLIFGIREFAFRLPSAIFASIWVFAVWRFGRERLGESAGWFAGFFAATSFWVMIIGRGATADGLLNCLVALAMFDACRYALGGTKTHLRRSFFWAGLGFLAKGPVAVVIPVAVTFLFCASRRRFADWFRTVTDLPGLGIFAAVSLPWYVANYMKEGQAFIEGFFFKHNVDRFISPMEGHSGGFLYYIPLVLVIVVPHSSLAIRILGRWREGVRDGFDRFMWLWFLFVLVFFSLSGTKLPHYLLHGITPLFLLMAKYRDDLKSRALTLVPAILFLGVIALLPDIIGPIAEHQTDSYARAMLAEAPPLLDGWYRFWAYIALAAVTGFVFAKNYRPWQTLIPAGIVTAFIVAHLLIPAVGEVQQGPVRDAARFAAAEDLDNVVVWGVDNPSFSVYRLRETPRRLPRAGDVVLTKVSRLERIPSYKLVYQQGGIVLAHVIVPPEQ